MVIITMKKCIESKVHLWNGSIGNSVIPRLTQRFHNCESRTKQYANIQSRQLSRLCTPQLNKIKFKPRVLALAPRRSLTCFLSHNVGNYARVS
jgi:hypothetical protein